MKLRNKKTGAIYSIEEIDLGNNADGIWLGMTKYTSLAELNEEWEDYEEPKDFWYIEPNGVIARIDEWDCCTDSDIGIMKTLGNHFETKEKAEKAVEKLKAWKRLKDKGFELSGCFDTDEVEDGEVLVMTNGYIPHIDDDILADLEIVFGDEV